MCSRCGLEVELESPDEFALECHVCEMSYSTASLSEAMWSISEGCIACQEHRNFPGDSVHVYGSWHYLYAAYEWKKNGKDAAELKREERTDYWEGVIHFCEPSEFASICEADRILASETGYFGKPAVCLTEATFGNWRDLQVRHGHCGFVFRKRDILDAGGGPALYMPESLIQEQKRSGFADVVKPFVNLLRISSATPGKRKHNFLHEREWRMPGDINLREVQPFGIIVDDLGHSNPHWKLMLSAAMEFEEIFVANQDD